MIFQEAAKHVSVNIDNYCSEEPRASVLSRVKLNNDSYHTVINALESAGFSILKITERTDNGVTSKTAMFSFENDLHEDYLKIRHSIKTNFQGF